MNFLAYHLFSPPAYSFNGYPPISIAISLIGRVFANGLGVQGSIPGRVISKTQKMARDAALYNTQRNKVRIKGKVEQSREWSRALTFTLV